MDNTGPDGTVFNLANWALSGTGALDGPTTNAGAANPFPLGTFLCLLDATFDPALSEQIKFYPNPVSEELVFETELELEAIRVFNLLGQNVLEIQNPVPNNIIAMSGLPSGIYTISFFTDGKFWSAQVVKQ